jgi:hypothetical protein
LKAGFEQAAGFGLDVPSYLVFATTHDGIEFWSTGPAPIFAMTSERIRSIEVGQSVTSRPVPSVVLNVTSVSGESVALEFVPSREGWELFPILDRKLTERFADEVRTSLGILNADG